MRESKGCLCTKHIQCFIYVQYLYLFLLPGRIHGWSAACLAGNTGYEQIWNSLHNTTNCLWRVNWKEIFFYNNLYIKTLKKEQKTFFSFNKLTFENEKACFLPLLFYGLLNTKNSKLLDALDVFMSWCSWCSIEKATGKEEFCPRLVSLVQPSSLSTTQRFSTLSSLGWIWLMHTSELTR